MRWYRLKLISEAEFFTEIFEDFVGLDNNFQENLLWKSNSIIKLMQVSDRTEDKKIIEEGLKIIIKLCQSKECGYLLDSYEIESFPINMLLEPERGMFDSILQSEFI